MEQFLRQYFPPTDKPVVPLSPIAGAASHSEQSPPLATPCRSGRRANAAPAPGPIETKKLDVLLRHAVPGALVILDLDETLIMAANGGQCALASAAGIKVRLPRARSAGCGAALIAQRRCSRSTWMACA